MAEAAVRKVCAMMARAIKHIKQEIKDKERRTRDLTERLKKLQSQPNPGLAPMPVS